MEKGLSSAYLFSNPGLGYSLPQGETTKLGQVCLAFPVLFLHQLCCTVIGSEGEVGKGVWGNR